MQKQINKKVNQARVRLAIGELVEVARWVFLWAGVIILGAVAVEKLLAVNIFHSYVVWGFSALCVAGLLVWWGLRVPSKKRTSVLVDERLRLKERMSSLMQLEGSDDLFAQAACLEAGQTIQQTDLGGHFPIHVSRNWFYSVSLWVVVGLLIAFLPQYDLLGYLSREKEAAKQALEVRQAEKQVELSMGSVKLAVKQLGDETLKSEFDQLAAIDPAQSPEAVKRQAIAKLGSMSDRIKQLSSDMNKDSLEMTKKMLRQLRPMSDMYSLKLQQAISKGQFSAAKDIINQAQKDLEQGKMSEADRKKLAEQLQNLAEQLSKIAAQNKQLEDELNKLGLDKKLAKLSAEDFKKALEKQGLTQKQIEQLMQKMSACKAACKSCSGLGQAMAAVSGGGGDMSELAGQLAGMEAFEEQLKAMQASLDEIENAMECLGKGMCKGMCKKCGSGNCQGLCGGSGSGKGGLRAGTGIGGNELDDVDTSNMKTLSTKVKNQKQQQGQVVASWYFKGEQVKGESVRPLGEVIQSGRDNAAEAISENVIPRRYEESVKNYFGGLEESIED